VITDEIDIEGIAVLEPKDNAPIRSDSYGSETLQTALQHVEAECRLIHGFYRCSSIEGSQNTADAINHVRRQLAAIIILIEALQPLMTKPLDHVLIVN